MEISGQDRNSGRDRSSNLAGKDAEEGKSRGLGGEREERRGRKGGLVNYILNNFNQSNGDKLHKKLRG